MKVKKVLIIILLCFMMCGCSLFKKTESVFYLNAVGDYIEYGDIVIEVDGLSDDKCTLNKVCSKYQEFTIDVTVGTKKKKNKYKKLSTKKKKYIKIEGTDEYFYVTVDQNQLAIAIAK